MSNNTPQQAGQVVYVPVSVQERLPEKEGLYHVIMDGGEYLHTTLFHQGKFNPFLKATHWLEPQPQAAALPDWKGALEEAATAFCDGLKEEARNWHKGQHVGLPMQNKDWTNQTIGFEKGAEWAKDWITQHLSTVKK